MDLDGRLVWAFGLGPNELLWFPHCVHPLPQGTVLVADGCNGRVMEVDQSGRVVWEFGAVEVEGFDLWSPRVIDTLPDGGLLAADAYNHRVVKLNRDFRPCWQYGGRRGSGDGELFWPRCVRQTPWGTVVVADSRNGRVIEVDSKGRRLRSLEGFYVKDNSVPLATSGDAKAGTAWRPGRFLFVDPHDVDFTSEGDLLVTDARLSLVAKVNWEGELTWAYGLAGELLDPHQARLVDGGCLITDTGHDRVLIVDWGGHVAWELTGSSLGLFDKPRWCEPLGNARYVVADTGHNRLVCVDASGRALWSFGETWGLDEVSLRAPRCVRRVGDRLVVSDTFNNRIIELARGGGSGNEGAVSHPELLHDYADF